MYRIACRYEPSHPRMAGKSKDAQLFTRGAWRVVDAYKESLTSLVSETIQCTYGCRYIFIPCVSRKSPRIGTLINPRKEVERFLTFRKECRA